jgi:hypothetical protein
MKQIFWGYILYMDKIQKIRDVMPKEVKGAGLSLPGKD